MQLLTWCNVLSIPVVTVFIREVLEKRFNICYALLEDGVLNNWASCGGFAPVLFYLAYFFIF